MRDVGIGAHSQLQCSCGWKGSPDQLRGIKAVVGDVPRWDCSCPNCERVIVYGSAVMGWYAKSDRVTVSIVTS